MALIPAEADSTLQTNTRMPMAMLSHVLELPMHEQYHLGLFDGLHTGPQYALQLTNVFHWMTKAAQAGNPKAQANLGVMYAMGLGTPINADQAFFWFTAAAMSEEPMGLYNLAIAYRNGDGTPRNYQAALQHFQTAAAEGFVLAMLALASEYEDCTRQAYNPEMALKILKRAAKAGDPDALYRLSRYYTEGKVIAKNARKAAQLMTEAAETGHFCSQINLRNYYSWKCAERRTKHWKPKPISDMENAIIWNYVMCQGGTGKHSDYLSTTLLEEANNIPLQYPRAEQRWITCRRFNEIMDNIDNYKDDCKKIMMESRQWAAASGIQALDPIA
jgi:TPR repeat protein